MSVEFGRRLLGSGAVGAAEVQAGLFQHLTTAAPFVRALVDTGGITERALDDELKRSTVPTMATLVPAPALVAALPRELCRTLLVVPIRKDPNTGVVDAAAVDPFDPHVAAELSWHLKCEVSLVRAPLSAVEHALARIGRAEPAAAEPGRSHTPVSHPVGVRPPSGPPIPLVRRALRQPDAARHPRVADEAEIEVLGVRDIVGPAETDGVSDDRNQAALPLTSQVPRAPAVPTFGASARQRADPSTEKSEGKRNARGSSPPQTSRGPFSPKPPAPPFADIKDILRMLRAAATRDEVVDQLIAGMSSVARRVGVFAIKKRGFCGIDCNSELGDREAFRAVEMAIDAATVLGTAVSKGSYLGPLPSTGPHQPLVRFLERSAGEVGEVAVLVVSVAGRPAVVLYADTLGDSTAAMKRAQELGREASVALSRVLAEAKSGKRSGT